eukprot:GDKI01004498.1.p1 GENE.GDKI01004498.1~~GDKI01004498.1.p1  ORF type:complete len:277 (-),score=85.96 GDKI01004498.1:83-913(-)
MKHCVSFILCLIAFAACLPATFGQQQNAPNPAAGGAAAPAAGEAMYNVATPDQMNTTYTEGDESNVDAAESIPSFGRSAEKGLIEEWEKHMQHFVPEMLVTFPLASRSDEYFYKDVTVVPTLIRGGYFVSADEDQSDVDFQITDPSGEVIFKRSQSEGLFYFQANMTGSYSFIVSNHRWMQTKIVTFAVGQGNDTALQPAHLQSLDENIQKVDKQLKDIQSDSTYLWIRQRSHMRAVQSTNSKTFWFALVEFLCLLAVSAFQVYYIKGLLSDRRLL